MRRSKTSRRTNPWSGLSNACLFAVVLALGQSCFVHAQATYEILEPILKQNLQSSSLVADQLRHFLLPHVPPLVLPASTQEWEKEKVRIRERELSVLYHGWPREWIAAPSKFEKIGISIERPGYTITRFRYEIVPGLYSSALLYEPKRGSGQMAAGQMPAVLDVVGHGAGGNAAEHVQKRCINQVRRGMVALSLLWFDFGELRVQGNRHDYLGLLDLAGANGAGLFYLAMRRGLDFLYDLPNVDRSRIGVTGLSGGGWQSILLSSLDPRIAAAVPVAGFSAMTASIEHPESSGDDPEQNASDLRQGVDYAQLAAMRAPQPTLLIYNAMDDCCFRAGLVKQGVYLDIKPFFALYGKPDDLQWHENENPGTHNYQIENRERSYEFFDSVFGLNLPSKEFADTDSEVKSYAELKVDLPANNLTIQGLAQWMAKSLHHELPSARGAGWVSLRRADLQQITRFHPVTVAHAGLLDVTHEKGVESRSYRLEFSNGLSATGILFRSAVAPQTGPATVLLADKGMPSTATEVGNDMDRGQTVFVFDPLFFGQNIPGTPDHTQIPDYAQMLNAVGERPLGLEAAQTVAVARWLHGLMYDASREAPATKVTPPSVRLVTTGPRAETVAMVAAAMAPEPFTSLEARQSLPDFMDLFDHPLTYFGPYMNEAPELMCLDLYRDFDFTTLTALASPVKVNLSAAAEARIFW